ncbi:hypothetical protein IEQ34_019827 [Dendrobium chrysotoxum]|uniref:Uncharacterized protein n=1 Tax=Dendrobium chrysotoxum TaxID=161865 RepID=A0AAV7G9J5_DENCH|nr:hypothetical protein IEQ34_019827 [Dendrobium chrysotoxum]
MSLILNGLSRHHSAQLKQNGNMNAKLEEAMMMYQMPVTSRCYVTTFRKICDAFVKIIDDEIEQTFRNLNIYQFLKFPAFQQCIPLLYEILKFWNSADEGFVMNGHLLKFISDEIALLTGINVEITFQSEEIFFFCYRFPTDYPPNIRRNFRQIISAGNSGGYYAGTRTQKGVGLSNISVDFSPEHPPEMLPVKKMRRNFFSDARFTVGEISTELRSHFLRWEGNTEMYYTQDSAAKLFKFLRNNEIYLVLQNIINEEAEKVYKCYNQNYEIFIQHINPDSVKKSNLIIQSIVFKDHWTLIIGRLKEKIWKLYDSLLNSEHKKICYEIKHFHKDKQGAFQSDITTWPL